MTEHTTENIEKLASAVVEGWDMDTLVEYAYTNLVNYYLAYQEEFFEEFNEFFGEE